MPSRQICRPPGSLNGLIAWMGPRLLRRARARIAVRIDEGLDQAMGRIRAAGAVVQPDGKRSHPGDSASAHREFLGKCLTGIGAIGVSSALQFIVSVATQVALARLLPPAVFGQFAFVAMVVGIVGTARSFNGGEYLVVVREPDVGRAYRSVFTFDLALGAITTAVTILLSRPIMSCAGRPELAGALALLMPSCLIVSLAIPGAMLRRRMSFARLQIPTIAGQVVSLVSKITLALTGFGLSSIILGELFRQLTEVVLLWMLADERPGIGLDFEQVKGALRFGVPLTISGLLAYYYLQVDTYIVGRTLSMEALGLYALAFRIPAYMFELKQAYTGLVYSALCGLHQEGGLAGGYSTITRYAAVVTLAPTVLVALYAEPFLRVAFGPAWIAAAQPLRILMAAMAMRVTVGYLADVTKVLQRTRVLLAFTAQNAIVLTVGAVLLTPRWGISGCACAVFLTIAASVPPTAFVAWRWLGVNLVALLARPACAAALTFALSRAMLPQIPPGLSGAAWMLAANSALVLAMYGGAILIVDPKVTRDLSTALDHLLEMRARRQARRAIPAPEPDSTALAPHVG